MLHMIEKIYFIYITTVALLKTITDERGEHRHSGRTFSLWQ